MKKLSILLSITVIILVAFILKGVFDSNLAKNKEKLTEASILTASTVLDTLRGKDTIDVLMSQHKANLSDDLYKKVKEYEATLKDRKDSYIDLDAIYLKKYSILNTLPQGYGTPEIVGEKSFSIKQEEISEQNNFDSRIEIINGIHQIATSKLTFNESGIASVLYDNIFIEIDRSEVTETYAMMLKNPTYIYKYTTSLYVEDAENFIDVLFTSVYDKSKKVVRIFNDGKKITDFEVRN